jgi:hypothetical protein
MLIARSDGASYAGFTVSTGSAMLFGDAVRLGVISDSEGTLLREVEALTARVIAVDDFDPGEVKPNYMTPGHNIRAAQRA